MKVDCITETGPVRSSNQDACDCGLFSSESAWALVCDGMGGANGGNVASSVATETIKRIVSSEFQESFSKDEVKDFMISVIAKANQAVYEMAAEHEELRGMGTTAVLMLAHKGLLHIAHVGDSRAYLKNGDGTNQLTVDHSYVQDLVNCGQITKEEARNHPRRNIITRVLGVYQDVQCDYTLTEFEKGNTALACSDGLSNYIEEAQMDSLLDQYAENSEKMVQTLVTQAIDQGSTDNVTVAVIENP